MVLQPACQIKALIFRALIEPCLRHLAQVALELR